MTVADVTLEEYKEKTSKNRMGLWLFIVSDSFVFIGLLVTRFSLLAGERPPLNQTLGLAVTALLLVSSFYMNRAEIEMSYGNIEGFLKNTLITLVLGIIFIVGVVGVEWQLAGFEGLTPRSGQAGAVFYIMTGFHAFHVLTGLWFVFVVYRNGKRGVYTQERHWGVEACAVYWHFIDVAWIFFYPALYLIGKVVEIG
jgi:cytochrome c oxidase subunit III